MPKPKGVKARGNGQGSAIRIRTNCWKAIAVIGYKDGKPIRRTKQGFATKAEALAYIPTLKRELPKGTKSIRLGEAYEKWFATLTCSKSTQTCYSSAFKMFNELLFINMNDLTIDDLQECLDSSEKGKRTKQNAKIALGLIYKWAIPRGYIEDNLNLAHYLKINSNEEVTRKPGFTMEQLETIKKAIHSFAGANLVYCHCYLGFRPTAFLALKKSDYNAEGRYFVGGIKTEAGKDRIVPVSPKIQPYVDELLAQPGEYVFSQDGSQMSLKVYRHIFYVLCEGLGFQKDGEHTLTPHSCRHTFATLMKRVQGADKDKLALMGHTTNAMLNHYQDVSVEDLRAITDKL